MIATVITSVVKSCLTEFYKQLCSVLPLDKPSNLYVLGSLTQTGLPESYVIVSLGVQITYPLQLSLLHCFNAGLFGLTTDISSFTECRLHLTESLLTREWPLGKLLMDLTLISYVISTGFIVFCAS